MVRPPKENRSQTQSTSNPETASYASPLDLPIGYRFAPEDAELILILHQWQQNPCLNHPVVHHVNIYDSNPQQLSERFEKGNDENEWFFISKRTKVCNGGKNLKRGNNEGNWEARTAAKKINAGKGVIGYKTILNYFVGKQSNSVETDWRMHEYSFKCSHDDNDKVDYALCKIFLTPRAAKKNLIEDNEAEKKEDELAIVNHARQVFVEPSEYQQQNLMMPEAEEQQQQSLMMMMMPEAEEQQQQNLMMMTPEELQQSLMMLFPELEDEQQHQQVTWSSLPPPLQDPQVQDSEISQNNDNNNIVPNDQFAYSMNMSEEELEEYIYSEHKFHCMKDFE